jgi:hypothetical protein
VAAFVDKGMESLVAGEPSPQFTARLRARIAEEQPAPRFAWLTWKPVAAGLVMAAALAVLALFLVRGHTNLASKSVRGPIIASTAAPGTHTPAEPTANPAERIGNYSPAARLDAGSLRVTQRHSSRRVHSATEPEVLVPRGELELVMRLAADIRSGQIDGKQLIAQQKQMEQPLKIDPLAISSVVKPQPYLYPPSDTLPDSAEP